MTVIVNIFNPTIRSSDIYKRLTGKRFKRTLSIAVMVGPLLTVLLLLFINLKKPWGFDESYNLQVVQNLRLGNGYATNGAVRGVGPYLFDPYISTGPAVLVPIYLVASIVRNTLLAARLVMVAYFLLMLVFLYRLTPRSNYGRYTYGLMVAGILPVVIATDPLWVQGEPPAITLLLLATLTMKRRMPALTGVALAAVVLCKLNFILAALVFMACLLISFSFDYQKDKKNVFQKSCRLLFGFSLPIILFEGYRFISLGGLADYQTNIRELRRFLDSQRLNHWASMADLLSAKLTSVIRLPGPHLWIALAISLIGLLIIVVLNSKYNGQQISDDKIDVAPAYLSGLMILGTFLFISSVPFVRQAASSFFLFSSLTILLALNRMRMLVFVSSHRLRALGVLTILMISAPLGMRTISIFENSIETIRASNFGRALDDQRAASKVIRDSGATSIVLDGWFQNPEYQLLSGVPAASMPDKSQNPIIVISMIKNYFSGTNDFLRQKEICREVLYTSENVLVCWPRIK
jgi:hypothetical protein